MSDAKCWATQQPNSASVTTQKGDGIMHKINCLREVGSATVGNVY